MAITNKDIEKLKEVFATKQDLERFATKQELNDKFGSLNDKFSEVLAGQDKIIKELETAREDRTLAVGKDRDQDRRLDVVEGRVAKIEQKVGV